ncbi:MAG: hypothetical protein V4492_04960 [Chlamydiota bacterium]
MASGIPRDVNGFYERIQQLDDTYENGVDAAKTAHRERLEELGAQHGNAILSTQKAFVGQQNPLDLGYAESQIAARVLQSLTLTNAPLPLASLLDGTPVEGEIPAPQYSDWRAIAFVQRQLDALLPERDFQPIDFYDRLETLWDRQMLPYERFPDFCLTRQEEITELQAFGDEQNVLQQTALTRSQGVIARDTAAGALSVSQTALHSAVQGQPVATPGMVTTVDLNNVNMGVVPRFIRQFSNLETLSLNGNGLTWVPYLGDLEQLTTLSLTDNHLTKLPMEGLLPEHLVNLHLDRNLIVVAQPYEDRATLANVTLADNPILCRPENDAPVFSQANLVALPLTVSYFQDQNDLVGEVTAASPLAHLYSMVVESGIEALALPVPAETQALFNALPDAVKGQVYGQIWTLSGGPMGDPLFGQSHVFDNGQLFLGALHNAILSLADTRLVPQQTAEFGNSALKKILSEALTRLPTAQVNQLYGQIWQNAGSPMGEPHYGRNHVLDSLAGFQTAFTTVVPADSTEPVAVEIFNLIRNFGAQGTKQNVALMALALDRP